MSEEQQNEVTGADVVGTGDAEIVDHHGHIEQVDLQTEMQRGRSRHGSVPSPRRQSHLRHPRASDSELDYALPAGAGTG